MTDVVNAAGHLSVSRETLDRLQVYADVLQRWSQRINLVSRATLSDLWRRHIVDSAQLLDCAPKDARVWVDLGAGAGLPAAIVAAIATEVRPGLAFTAIESDARKCAFMMEAARAMDVLLDVRCARIETVCAFAADVVSARALAPLPKLLGLASPFLAGVGLFPKGARHADELSAASVDWRFDHRTLPSRTESSAAILEIRRLRRVRE